MDLMRMPADYDRLPEFRKLVAEIIRVRTVAEDGGLKKVLEHPQHAASLIWLELWCALTYETAGGQEVGNIARDSAEMQLNKLKLELLLAAGTLQSSDLPTLFFCPVYARYNKHLSPSFEPVWKKGNRHSKFSRRFPLLAEEAQKQMLLLPPEVCHRADGVAMTPDERKAAMSMVFSIDGFLNRKHRELFDYSAGLMADALGFYTRFPNDSGRMELLLWLSDRITHPSIPKTTEQILANIEAILTLKRSEQVKERL